MNKQILEKQKMDKREPEGGRVDMRMPEKDQKKKIDTSVPEQEEVEEGF